MSFNLNAWTKNRYKKIELMQLNTQETFECLGYTLVDGVWVEPSEKLPWKTIRGRYLDCVRKKGYPDASEHIRHILRQPFFIFDYE